MRSFTSTTPLRRPLHISRAPGEGNAAFLRGATQTEQSLQESGKKRNKQQTNEMGSRDHVRYIGLEGQFITHCFNFCNIEYDAHYRGGGIQSAHKSSWFAREHARGHTRMDGVCKCDLPRCLRCVPRPVSKIMKRIIVAQVYDHPALVSVSLSRATPSHLSLAELPGKTRGRRQEALSERTG